MSQVKLEKMLRSLRKDSRNAKRLTAAELTWVITLEKIYTEDGSRFTWVKDVDRRIYLNKFIKNITDSTTYDNLESADYLCHINTSCLSKTPVIWQKFMAKWQAVVEFWSHHQEIVL